MLTYERVLSAPWGIHGTLELDGNRMHFNTKALEEADDQIKLHTEDSLSCYFVQNSCYAKKHG